jgi:hypothetical protein
MASVNQPVVQRRLHQPILSHRVFFFLHHPNLAACRPGLGAVTDQRLTHVVRPGRAAGAQGAALPFGIFLD